ncbi:hypothetical protein F5I97DRAFT_1859214 [Phlebopus sp. FC_14]|nr:hypothetical protein F5I97DRAFT_1859214 [Phlebopus sp. FC_14]
MSAIPQPASQPWVVDPSRTPLTYTRPLVGSECFADRVSVMFDGSGDVCMGVNFSSPISKQELKQRARGALDKLRFACPIIAASIEGPEDGVSTRNWVYSPVANDWDRQAWLDVAFSFEERGASLNTYDFIRTTNTKRLPYEVNGKTSLFRCYLLADNTGGYGLYFHGPHAIMDGWPTLHALALMFGWMSDAAGSPSTLEFGTEWMNLPVDPITATGGPRDNWESAGIQLLQEVAAQQLRPVPCHTLAPPSRATNMDRKPIRIKHTFPSSETKALVDATRRSGFSVTHLLEAAHCLALFACNPLESNVVPEVDFSAETTIFSLEREFTASVNPTTHLISSFSVMPVRIPMAGPLKADSPQERLQMTMEALKAQYTHYLDNPCLSHVLAAQLSVPPTPSPPADQRRMFTSVFTNLGVVEKRLPTRWQTETSATKMDIDELALGHRMTDYVGIHSWTINSRMHIQVQSADVWDDGYLERFLEEMCNHVRLILLTIKRVHSGVGSCRIGSV